MKKRCVALFILIINLLVVSCAQKPDRLYDPEISLTYQEKYSDLKNELAFAEIRKGDERTGRKNLGYFEDPDLLIEIVREFDKLKAEPPKDDLPKSEEVIHWMFLAIKRHGEVNMTTYGLLYIDSVFYYEEYCGTPLKEVPKYLVELLGLDRIINHGGINYEIINGEIADFLDYNYQTRSMYIAGLKVFDEFGTSNEGNVSIYTNDNTMTFTITKSTGTVTGTLDGPRVYFKMELAANEIVEKEFTPAPNYAELGMTDFIEHSEEVIELTDERLVEVGSYFKELIMEIEAD